MRSSCLILLTLLCLAAVNLEPAECQMRDDWGVPDSAYLLSAYYEPEDCNGGVKCIIPLYLYTDWSYLTAQFRFNWNVSATYNTILAQGDWTAECIGWSIQIDTVGRAGYVMVACDDFAPWPSGAGIVAELVFDTHLSDTVVISFPYTEFGLYTPVGFNGWIVTFQSLDSTYIVPDTLAMAAGDVDCSGSVDISDVVYLIIYIFGGGTPPYDLNSADVDQSCIVDISDAVYLITYIFGGGPAPLPGCVVP